MSITLWSAGLLFPVGLRCLFLVRITASHRFGTHMVLFEGAPGTTSQFSFDEKSFDFEKFHFISKILQMKGD